MNPSQQKRKRSQSPKVLKGPGPGVIYWLDHPMDIGHKGIGNRNRDGKLQLSLAPQSLNVIKIKWMGQ